MQKVLFNTADRSLTIKGKAQVKEFISYIFAQEGKTLHRLNYIFCSDKYLLEINREFLKHDFYTDIITFDLTEEEGVVGEMYVSVDRVKDNASSANLSYGFEILRVLFHGALHLCGYLDKKKSEITIMREKEEYYLSLFEQKYS